VYRFSASFIGACEGSRRLYLGYGVANASIHLAPLCTNNQRFADTKRAVRVHDLIFCSRFVPHKNPLFALAVAAGVAKKLGRRVSLRFVGQGPLESEIRSKAKEFIDSVDTSFAGYLSQEDLPGEYARARVFLFPTAFDPWGVVVNEACASGVPCIVSPHTGVAGELVREGVNGHVHALDDMDGWIDHCVRLLTDERTWRLQSDAARHEVSRYTFDEAAQGVRSALRQVVCVEVAA
jgi:glycosyltransferase involved in cell wall biosynthesis